MLSVRYPVSQLKSFIDFSQPPQAGESAPRSHLGSQGVALNTPFGDCTTLYATFWRAVRLNPDEPMLGARTFDATLNKVGAFHFQSYKDVAVRVNNLGAALRALGLEAKARVGLYAANRPEWVIGEQACFANNLITVPLFVHTPHTSTPSLPVDSVVLSLLSLRCRTLFWLLSFCHCSS